MGAYYLKHLVKFSGRVYLLGGSGLQQEMELLDLPYSSSAEDQVPPKDASEVVGIEIERDIGAVLVGYDPGFNLRMVTKACSYLKNPDCVFVGTNEDSCLPIDSPLLVPGMFLHALCSVLNLVFTQKKKNLTIFLPTILTVSLSVY